MNTMIFLAGLGAGAFAASMLFIAVIHVLVRSRGDKDKAINDANRASIDELKRRNDIGEDQRLSLRAIATSCEQIASVQSPDVKVGRVS